MRADFEPNVIGILCNWCSYGAADGAGASHLGVPATFYPMRVMCTGRVEPAWILRSFSAGTDGVLLCGCHLGDCHYVDGNCKAFGRIGLLRGVLSQWGVEPDRLRVEWVGVTETARFASVVNAFVDRIRALGPVRALGSEQRNAGETTESPRGPV